MDFKQQIQKHGDNQGWDIKTLSDSMVLKSKRGEITITWRGVKPDTFTISISVPHFKMGSVKNKKKDISIAEVLTYITNPTKFIGNGLKSFNDKNRKAEVQRYHAKKNIITLEDIQKKRDKSRYKVTGRMALYKEIWKERPHKSEISGEPLIENQHHPLWRNQFMHILPHSQYKHYEFRKENIILGTHEEHTLQTNNVGKCMEDPKWDNFFARFAALREDYERELKAGNFKYNKL